MKLILAVAGLAVAAGAVWAWKRGERAAGGDPDLAAVVAMLISENGPRSGDDAQALVAEVFQRNARRAQATARQVLAGKGGPLAPWPTAAAYAPLMARSRLYMGANPERAAELAAIAKVAAGGQRAPGATNWTHGAAPFAPWLAKGYRVVASAGVQSRTRPYLWVYEAP